MTETPLLGYVVKMFPRFSETFIVNEILELERRGQPVVVYSLKRPPAGPRHAMLDRLRAEVVYLPESPWRAAGPLLSVHAALLTRAPRRYLGAVASVLARRKWAAVKRFLQAGLLLRDAERRGVVHLHAHFATSATRVAMHAARLSGLTYSFTAHAKDIYLRTHDPALLREKIEQARFVVTVSDYNREHLAHLVHGEHARRIVRVYNGVDLTRFQPSDAPREPDTVLCVARLVEKKGVSDLVAACAVLRRGGRRVVCRIVGDGPLRGALESLRRSLGIEDAVEFLGPLPQERVADALRRAAVFALPCVIAADGNRDGLPTVILEAMASGTPVVSTRVTGIPEMIDDGETGRIVPPSDPQALASALAELLDDAALRERMGAAARQRVVACFSLTGSVDKLHPLLQDALADADAARAAEAAALRHGSMRVGESAT